MSRFTCFTLRFADMSGYKYITGVQLSLPRLVIVFNGPVMTTSGAAFFVNVPSLSVSLSHPPYCLGGYLKLCYIKGLEYSLRLHQRTAALRCQRP